MECENAWTCLKVQVMSFSQCRNHRNTKKYFFLQNRKKFTSPANEFLLHKCRNNRKPEKYILFSNLKKCTSFFWWKNAQVHLMSFCNIDGGTIFFFQIWKNLQVQLMSFYHINVATIGKWKNIYFFKSEKMHKSFLTSFSYNRKMKK